MAKRKRMESPLAEHITDYSDMELCDDSFDDIVLMCESEKRDKDDFDDSDKEWMYNEQDDKNVHSDSEDALWDDVNENEPLSSPQNPVISKDVDKYMTSAVWFHEMSERGMTDDEKRYVELEKFYFGKIDSLNISKKNLKLIRKIHDDIEEKKLCTES